MSIDARVAIVASEFNRLVTGPLTDGARTTLEGAGFAVDLHWVPGSWELPLALDWLARTGRYAGLVAIGCVIRGATPHFEYVAGEAAKGAARVQAEHRIPVGFGVLTTENLEQAFERAGSKMGNKGSEAALAVIQMLRLKARIG
ncbi:MAG: 6,7-dimethyl-8-ribityllumazine synthase [Myxococcota bacterium]